MTKFPLWQAYNSHFSPGKHLPPPVPIKTYQWEEVRREKVRGDYPWTHIFKGPYQEHESTSERDHEYEPINPPPSSSQPSTSPPILTVTDQEGQETVTEPDKLDFRPIFESKHQYLRIPLDRDQVIPIDKAEIESLRYNDDEEEEELEKEAHQMTAQEIQDQIEERFFAATPDTTVSRTDGEFNTSQMDSSGLEELPLKKDVRRGFSTRGFQQKFQSQAGRLKSRIRSIPRPKFNLPERPKFNLPERPKFNLPERPKFNMKRPDLKMPNFNFGKSKTSSIRRPLRDRSQIPSNQSTVGSKKNIFDSINFRTYPRIFSKKKKAANGRRAMTPPPRMETESTPPSSPASRTGPINQRWSQRFKDIKFADDDNQSDLKKPSFDDDVEDDSAPFRDSDLKAAVELRQTNERPVKAVSSSSIPGSDKEQHSSGSSTERRRAGVIEEIDSDEFFLREKGLSREDVDVSRYLSLEIRDAFRSPKNALARIDKESFEEDEESYELKPPTRTSGEPIRHSMERIRDQSLEQIRMTPEQKEEYPQEIEVEVEEPLRPERTRSLKKRSTRSRSEETKSETDKQFNTFPPNRPSRQKQSSESKQSIMFDDYQEEHKENRNQEINKRQPSVPSLAITDTTKELSPTRYMDESSEALDEPWIEEPQPPLPPKRRKSTRDSSQDNESIGAHHYNRDHWLEDGQHEDLVLDNEIALQRGNDRRPLHNGYYDSPPALPIRKTRSQATSLADEDRTSRGADSLISETRTHLTEDIQDFRPEFKAFTPDYAVVERTVIEVQPKSSTLEKPKPTRPPPPSRKKKTVAQLTALKNQGINFFYTYPRRAIKKSLQKHPQAPVRPLRNYSSIGPCRPPRRNRVFREPVYEGEFIPLRGDDDVDIDQEHLKDDYISSEKIDSILLEQEAADEKLSKHSELEEIQDMRDLQSGDVIEKMKGRPLPPPPRPPRRYKDDQDYEDDRDVEVTDLDAEVTDLDAEEEVLVQRINIQVSHSQHEPIRQQISTSSVPDDERYIDELCDWQQDLEFQHSEQPEERVKSAQEEPPQVIEEPPVKAERRKKSLSVAKRAATPVAPVESTASTQTDRLPEGFYVEEEQQTTGDYSKSEGTSTKTPDTEKKVEVEKRVETIIEHKVVVIPTPETEILKAKKIHVTELDVEKLNVTELQAQKITVSDIDGVSMQVSELYSKNGHLVLSGIELPSSFLEAITPQPPPAPIIQTQSATQTRPEMVDSQTNTTPKEETPPPRPTAPKPQILQEPVQEEVSKQHSTQQEEHPQSPPAPIPTPPLPQKRPSPPPAIVIQTPQGQSSAAYVPGFIPASPPPRSPPRSRAHGHDSEEELRMIPRRRRHHSHKYSTQYSTDEEDEEEFPTYPLARRPPHREATSTELIRQLLHLWQTTFMHGVDQVIEGLNTAFPEGEKRKDAQTAACIVLVLIAGLIMLGFGQDHTVHHHHWDFLPPHP